MVMKTALITLISTLLIAVLALRSQESGNARPASAPAWTGGGSMSVTGASTSFSGNGQSGNWGRNGSMSITGASGSFSNGGGRGNWGGDRDHHDDDGWESGDDD